MLSGLGIYPLQYPPIKPINEFAPDEVLLNGCNKGYPEYILFLSISIYFFPKVTWIAFCDTLDGVLVRRMAQAIHVQKIITTVYCLLIYISWDRQIRIQFVSVIESCVYSLDRCIVPGHTLRSRISVKQSWFESLWRPRLLIMITMFYL